jgi:hypothetical protein
LQTVQVLFEQYWQPARADYPVLMTRDVNSVQFSGSLSRLTLSSGSYPSEFRGLIHLTDTASVILNNAFYLYGSLVAEGTITTSGTMALVCDPKLLSDPPVGYQKGDVLTPVPGSWKWDQWP